MAARKTSSRRSGKGRAKAAKPKKKSAATKVAKKKAAPRQKTATAKRRSGARTKTPARLPAAKKAAKAKRPVAGKGGTGKVAAGKAAARKAAAPKAAPKAKPASKAKPKADGGKAVRRPVAPAPRRPPNDRRAPQGREAAGRKAMHRPAPREAAAPRPAPKLKAKPAVKAPVAPAPRGAGEADDLNLLADLVARAKRAGADAADALLLRATSLSQAMRLGNPEKLERSEGQDLGLRVLVGRRQAVVSTSDFGGELLNELVERAVAMARSVPEDPFIGLADPAEIARDWVTLDMADPVEPDPAWLLEAARKAEEAARAVKGVTNSEGAEASWGRSQIAFVASNGFAGGYGVSRFGIGVSVLAGEGTAMERDDDFTSAVYRADLKDPATVGRNAGERAVRRLNPRKAETAKLPVLFEARVANSLVGHLASAINGSAIARGTSFLKDRMNARILPEGVDVIDDPLRRRGLRSRPFDGEGIAGRVRKLVEDGVLKSWILDLRSARQLGLRSTGHGARGTSSPPSPGATNLYLTPGRRSPAELIGEIERGLYVTDLMGFGVNGVTGDYSRGAAGFWIEKGKLAYPVSEITIAGNLKEMYRALEAANDLEFKYGTDAPTIRIDGMTLAGK